MLDKFLAIAKDTFILNLVEPFFTDARREMSKMRKIYFTDIGLASLLSDRLHVGDLPTLLNHEHLATFIYNELARQKTFDAIYFYRTIAKASIDFILKIGDKLIPVQIAADRRRLKEGVSVRNFIKKYGACVPHVIIVTHDEELRIDNAVIHLPATLLSFMKFDTLL